MDNLIVTNCKNAGDAMQAGGKRLSTLLSETIEPKLLLCSGGSALDMLEFTDLKNVNEFLTVTVLDERFSTSIYENNFAQLTNTRLYEQAKNKNCTFIDTRIEESQTIDVTAAKFLAELRQWIMKHTTGKIFATVGIGSDGHTAGILPFPEDPSTFEKLFMKENLVAQYNAGDKTPYPFRVTTTFAFFKLINSAVGVVLGEGKKPALQTILQQKGSLAQTPALGLRSMQKVDLFSDIILN